MPPPQRNQPTFDRPAAPVWQPAVPSWLISLIFHMALVLILGLVPWTAAPTNAAAEKIAQVGIALKHHSDGDTYYESEGGGGQSAVNSADAHNSANAVPNSQSPSDPTAVLPAALDVIGPGGPGGGGVPSPNPLPGLPPGVGEGVGGEAQIEVFGLPGKGYKFCYVFDHSVSMAWNDALEVAKAQLSTSLRSLGKTHQFQIIFFNENPTIPPIGRPGQLLFANQRNKDLARGFIGGIKPFGATDREKALVLALKLHPDVVFFLTDADDPMTASQLAKINRMASGIAINAIEFGSGPQRRTDNFLVRLAGQNGGRYKYIDISGF